MITKKKSRGEQAIEGFHEAERIDARPRVQWGDDVILRQEAKRARQRTAELLKPVDPVTQQDARLVEGAGEVVVLHLDRPGEDREAEIIANSLDEPTSATSGRRPRRSRTSLASQAAYAPR